MLQTQLLPDPPTSARLRESVERFNAACNWLAGVAFEHQCSRTFDLHKITYRDLREKFGLPSDMALRCLAQVCDVYKRDKGIRPKFRKHAAVPYSMGKNIGFKGIDRVSISTLEGRVVVPFIMGKYQADRFTLKKGQSDLVLRKDGKWFLIVTVDVPDGTPIEPSDFIGVDMGSKHLATTDDGENFTGEAVEACRRKYQRIRKTCQRTGTKSAKRKLREARRKESNFRKDVTIHTG